MNQKEYVLQHMKTYGTITPVEAFCQYGILRLGAIIFDLKNSGVDISREMVTGKNRFGKTTRYARYRLHNLPF